MKLTEKIRAPSFCSLLLSHQFAQGYIDAENKLFEDSVLQFMPRDYDSLIHQSEVSTAAAAAASDIERRRERNEQWSERKNFAAAARVYFSPPTGLTHSILLCRFARTDR